MFWVAETPLGAATYTGRGVWTADRELRRRIVERLAAVEYVSAVPAGPSFPTRGDMTGELLLAVLLTLAPGGVRVTHGDAPWADVVPPLPDDAVG